MRLSLSLSPRGLLRGCTFDTLCSMYTLFGWSSHIAWDASNAHIILQSEPQVTQSSYISIQIYFNIQYIYIIIYTHNVSFSQLGRKSMKFHYPLVSYPSRSTCSRSITTTPMGRGRAVERVDYCQRPHEDIHLKASLLSHSPKSMQTYPFVIVNMTVSIQQSRQKNPTMKCFQLQ